MTAIADVNGMMLSLTGDVYDLDGLVDRLTSATLVERIWTMREGRIDGVGGLLPTAFKEASLWRWCGVPFAGGVTPTVWANPTRATAGALGQADPVSVKRLASVCASAPSRGWFTIYDRLAHMAGLDGTSVAVQNVNGGADGTWSRYAGDHVGNQIWVEIYDAIGVTARTITASYKNQSGATKTTLPHVIGATGNLEGSRIIRLPLAQDDTGVSAVISVTLSASTGTAGNFGVTVARPIATIAMAVGNGSQVSILDGALPEIEAGACIAVAWGSASGVIDNYMGLDFCFVEDS